MLQSIHTIVNLLLLSVHFSAPKTLSLYPSIQLVKEKGSCVFGRSMSWSSAQQYCRDNHKDLAMIENQEENMEALNAKPSSSMVWIGLYREPWIWSDGSTNSFRNWYPTGLNNIDENQHCAIVNPKHDWVDEFCDVPYVFVCHQGDHSKKC
uniref:C-type lectin domain-containing protein n=1 Tax=Oryzias melastigma TaxID=30732 RepID=A0A3B3DZ14_ORYME